MKKYKTKAEQQQQRKKKKHHLPWFRKASSVPLIYSRALHAQNEPSTFTRGYARSLTAVLEGKVCLSSSTEGSCIFGEPKHCSTQISSVFQVWILNKNNRFALTSTILSHLLETFLPSFSHPVPSWVTNLSDCSRLMFAPGALTLKGQQPQNWEQIQKRNWYVKYGKGTQESESEIGRKTEGEAVIIA